MPSHSHAALLVIGNEILSGRTVDKNINTIACGLFAHGVDLIEVRIVPDIEKNIIKALHELMPKVDYLFTTGGIGPTHDDITASCVAKACDMPFGLHPEADRILASYYDGRRMDYNPARKRMAYMPLNVTLIPNESSGAPGFQCQNIYVLPGVPSIMQVMFDQLLSSGRIAKGQRWHTRSLIVHKAESEIAAQLLELENAIAGTQIGSYPRQDDEGNYSVNVVIRHRELDVLDRIGEGFQTELSKQSIRFEVE